MNANLYQTAPIGLAELQLEGGLGIIERFFLISHSDP